MNRARLIAIAFLGVIIGTAVVGIGYVVGRSSHQVTYNYILDGHIIHYISGTSQNHHVSYFQLSEDSALFYIHESNFKPAFDVSALGNSGHVALAYASDTKQSIDVKSNLGTHLSGKGYRVIAIAPLDNGSQLYAEPAFLQHPHGYFFSLTNVAYVLYTLGGLVAILSLIFRDQALVVAGTTLAGAAAPPIAWLFLLSALGRLDLWSGNPSTPRTIMVALIAGGVGAIVGLIIGWRLALNNWQDERSLLRRKARKEKHVTARHQKESLAATALTGAASNWAEWSNRGNNLDTLKRYDEAVQAYDQALALMPADAPLRWAVLNNKAETLKNAGRYTEALAVNDQALALQPSAVTVLTTRALTLLMLNRFTDAAPIYESVLRQSPNDVTVLNNLSVIYGKTGRFDEALRLCRRVLEIDPDNPLAQGNLAAFNAHSVSATLRVANEDET